MRATEENCEQLLVASAPQLVPLVSLVTVLDLECLRTYIGFKALLRLLLSQ